MKIPEIGNKELEPFPFSHLFPPFRAFCHRLVNFDFL